MPMNTPSKNLTAAEQRAEYEAWYEEQVRLGLEDLKAGRVVSDEQATEHMRRLRDELRAPKIKHAA